MHGHAGAGLRRLDAARFKEGFRDWGQDAFELADSRIVPSFNNRAEQDLHMVNLRIAISCGFRTVAEDKHFTNLLRSCIVEQESRWCFWAGSNARCPSTMTGSATP